MPYFPACFSCQRWPWLQVGPRSIQPYLAGALQRGWKSSRGQALSSVCQAGLHNLRLKSRMCLIGSLATHVEPLLAPWGTLLVHCSQFIGPESDKGPDDEL